jgi:hypothetical protein
LETTILDYLLQVRCVGEREYKGRERRKEGKGGERSRI